MPHAPCVRVWYGSQNWLCVHYDSWSMKDCSSLDWSIEGACNATRIRPNCGNWWHYKLISMFLTTIVYGRLQFLIPSIPLLTSIQDLYDLGACLVAKVATKLDFSRQQFCLNQQSKYTKRQIGSLATAWYPHHIQIQPYKGWMASKDLCHPGVIRIFAHIGPAIVGSIKSL